MLCHLILYFYKNNFSLFTGPFTV